MTHDLSPPLLDFVIFRLKQQSSHRRHPIFFVYQKKRPSLNSKEKVGSSRVRRVRWVCSVWFEILAEVHDRLMFVRGFVHSWFLNVKKVYRVRSILILILPLFSFVSLLNGFCSAVALRINFPFIM